MNTLIMQTGMTMDINQAAKVVDTSVANAVTTNDGAGISLIQPGTPLTRLNYFDGKFLRASDLQGEQNYFRELIALSNQAGGAGVVYGLDVTLAAGDQLNLSAGLGIGPGGRVLYLPQDATISVQKLIDATSQVSPAATPKAGGGADFADCIADTAAGGTDGIVHGAQLYLITVCHAEGLCGEEDVYGKLCEDACVTSTDRPFRVEGVVVRATPLQLTANLATSKVVPLTALHQRSLIASAYFESERTAPAHQSLISGAGLRSGAWCVGAVHEDGCGVPVGVIARAGRTTLFLDEWTARRERIDAPPRSYWAWKMMMRPWNVFLAQILQFQCQLHEVLGRAIDPGAGDAECSEHEAVLAKVSDYLSDVRRRIEQNDATAGDSLSYFKGGVSGLADMASSVSKALLKVAKGATDRVLIRGGIVELPSAGYLPVVAGSSVSVNDQVRALLGDGVDLRFCIVRPDYVAHALETAQHMERISLLTGLDDPTKKPEVDILVPDGSVNAPKGATDTAYRATMHMGVDKSGALGFKGAARTQQLDGGGRAFHLAGIGQAGSSFSKLVTGIGDLKAGTVPTGGLSQKTAETPIDFTSKFVDGTSRVTDALRTMRFDRVNASGAFADATIETKAVQPVLLDYLGTGGTNVDGEWLTMRTDRPLSTLGASAPTAHISGRLVIGNVLRSVLSGMELSLSGTASFLREYPDVGAGRRIDAALSLVLTATTIKETAASELEVIMARRITQTVAMTFTGDDSLGQVTVEMLSGNLGNGLHIRTGWGAPANTVRSEVFTVDRSTTPPTEMSLVDVRLSDEPAVVTETNASHQYATSGLAIVQSVLFTEDAFEHDALAALFAPLAGNDSFAIRAVTDWVLFHRRRTRQCDAPPPAKAVEPARRYRVFEITAKSADEAKVWFGKAQSADPAAQAEVARKLAETTVGRTNVGAPELIVEFDGGQSALRSDPTAIAADWPAFSPGASLAFALVARPNADRTVELARLGSVESAIPSTVTDTSHVLGAAYLTTVLTGWADTTTDGAMLLITVAAVVAPAVCQRTFGVQNADAWKLTSDQLQRIDDPAAMVTFINGMIVKKGIVDFGAPLFSAGTATPNDAAQLASMKGLFTAAFPNAQNLDVAVWILSGDNELQTHVARASATGAVVSPAVAFQAVQQVASKVDPALVTINGQTCPAVTFLIARS